jgi:hypothetical protein
VSDSSVEGVIDLLGMLAYGELVAFDRMAADARLAPDLTRRGILCEMAAVEIANYRRVADRLIELGADVEAAMTPFEPALTAYHDETEPISWHEALIKAYIGNGISDDFFREIAAWLEPADRDLVLQVIHDSAYDDYAAEEIRAAIAVDPKIVNALSMWARRLVGEALSQAVRVASERPALAALLGSSAEGGGDAPIWRNLTTAHSARMTAVGLNN